MLNMKNLRERKGTTTKPRGERFLVPLPHPNQDEILAKIDLLESGDVEDATSVLTSIRELLTSDAPHISFSTTKTDQAGTPTQERFLATDGKPEVGYTVFMIYLQKPDPSLDLQGAIYRSFGRNRGWDKDALLEINGEYRKALGIQEGTAQAEPDRISDGDAAPTAPGEQPVLPS